MLPTSAGVEPATWSPVGRRITEAGTLEIEEIVKEMKERDREERGTGMKVKKQKK